jgi:hypothetical protein
MSTSYRFPSCRLLPLPNSLSSGSTRPCALSSSKNYFRPRPPTASVTLPAPFACWSNMSASTPKSAPHSAPRLSAARARLPPETLRKRNLPVYDIQPELAQTGHRISINALTVLLREEGCARIPRRLDEERPATLKPQTAEVADISRSDLSPHVPHHRRRAAGEALCFQPQPAPTGHSGTPGPRSRPTRFPLRPRVHSKGPAGR